MPPARTESKPPSFAWSQISNSFYLPQPYMDPSQKFIRSLCRVSRRCRTSPSSRRSPPISSATRSTFRPTPSPTLAVRPICPPQACCKGRFDMGTPSSQTNSNSMEPHQQRQTRYTTAAIEQRKKKGCGRSTDVNKSRPVPLLPSITPI